MIEGTGRYLNTNIHAVPTAKEIISMYVEKLETANKRIAELELEVERYKKRMVSYDIPKIK